MNKKNDFLFVYVTAPSLEEAKNIVRKIVENRLAACGNILPKMQSFYWWDGKVNMDEEVVLILKCPERNFLKVQEMIKQNHSYECPCIIAMPIVDGAPEYMKWLLDETA